LLEKDFTEVATGPRAGVNDLNASGNVGGGNIAVWHDERTADRGVDLPQRGDEVTKVLSAAREGLIPEPSVKGDVHTGWH
jgi:hypothetical protein